MIRQLGVPHPAIGTDSMDTATAYAPVCGAVAVRPIAHLGGPAYAALGEIILRPALQRPPDEASVASGSPADREAS